MVSSGILCEHIVKYSNMKMLREEKNGCKSEDDAFFLKWSTANQVLSIKSKGTIG